jgi:hypothetical protein
MKSLKMQGRVLSYDDSEITKGVREADLIGLDKDDGADPMGDWLMARLKQMPDLTDVRNIASSRSSFPAYRVRSAKLLTEENWMRLLEPVKNKLQDVNLKQHINVEVLAETDNPSELPKQLREYFAFEIASAEVIK